MNRQQKLEGALKELIAAVRTINHRPTHQIKVEGDDEPCYWQRKEWVDWILEGCDQADRMLAELRAELPDCGHPACRDLAEPHPLCTAATAFEAEQIEREAHRAARACIGQRISQLDLDHPAGMAEANALREALELLARPTPAQVEQQPVYQKPNWGNNYGYNKHVDMRCRDEANALVEHLEGLLDEVPEGPLYTTPVRPIPAQIVPPGYTIVPAEPTPEMIAAGDEVEDLYRRGTPATWGKVYRAMLEAALAPQKDCAWCAGAGHDYYGEACQRCQPAPQQSGLVSAVRAYLDAIDTGSDEYDVKRARSGVRHALAAPQGQSQAERDVLAERRRQVEAEGMSTAGDDCYCAAELPRAAAAYILNGANDDAPAIWPWAKSWWKPRDARSNYVRAGALILAEIERLDRAARPQGGE